MYEFDKNDIDHCLIKSWFLEWETYVQNKNYSSAKNLFDKNVLSFGTWMDVIQGLTELESNQWKNIWPTISKFKFFTDTLFIQLSSDKSLANSVLIWDSLGFSKDGSSFERSGRATVTLKRDNFNSNWKGIHTHFSLNRGIPQQSFGNFK